MSTSPLLPPAMADCLRDLEPRLIQWRRDLHRHPETAWTEFRTASLAAQHLMQLGYQMTMGTDAVCTDAMTHVPHDAVLRAAQQRAVAQGAPESLVARMTGGHTGFWADIDCGPGPLVCVRVDMDANDITESDQTDHRPCREGFRSEHAGAMHACGHDGHVAIGLGLASVLAAGRSALRGRIRLLFQPAEEGAYGARAMLSGVNGVDVLLGMHLGIQSRRCGEIVCGTRNFLATSKADVTFFGRAAHAGMAPEEGRNALLAACTATLHLHGIARNAKGDTRITVGRLEGGTAHNIIPAEARLFLETRGISSEVNDYMLLEARRMVQAAADMWGCTQSTELSGHIDSASSDSSVARVVAEAAADMPWFTDVIHEGDFGASEDFSTLLHNVQSHGGAGAYMQMGTRLADGHHCPRFDFDERALCPAVEVLARTVARLASNA